MSSSAKLAASYSSADKSIRRDPATEAFISECLSETPSYPSGSTFIDTTADWAARAVRHLLRQGTPVVLVGGDGSCRLLDPRQSQITDHIRLLPEASDDRRCQPEFASSRPIC